jgi:hypothetical protein
MEEEEVKLWIRKHSHLLSFIGASIVFLTFIVKEGLGERWRHTLETIDTAEYFYSIRDDTAELSHNTDLILAEVLRIESKTQGKEDLFPVLMHQVTSLGVDLGSIDGRLTAINVLVNSLHANDRNRQTASQLKFYREEYLKQFQTINDLMSDLDLPKADAEVKSEAEAKAKSKTQYSQLDILELRIYSLRDSLKELRGKVDALQKEVLADAEATRDRNKDYSTLATLLSWSLFTIGWGLGLLGKVYGVPEATGGD